METRAVPVDVTVPDGFTVGRKGRWHDGRDVVVEWADGDRPGSRSGRWIEILEEAARAAAVPVQRLSDTLLRCGETAGIIFYGLTGQTCGRSAEMLCSNDAWLRAPSLTRACRWWRASCAMLAAGTPPARPRPRWASRSDSARPWRISPVYEVAGPEELPQAWRAVADRLPPRAQLLLEQAPVAQELHLAVVAGRGGGWRPGIRRRRRRSLTSRFGPWNCCQVPSTPRWSSGDRGGAWIYRVDPLLRRWARHPEPAARIAAAILATELD